MSIVAKSDLSNVSRLTLLDKISLRIMNLGDTPITPEPGEVIKIEFNSISNVFDVPLTNISNMLFEFTLVISYSSSTNLDFFLYPNGSSYTDSFGRDFIYFRDNDGNSNVDAIGYQSEFICSCFSVDPLGGTADTHPIIYNFIISTYTDCKMISGLCSGRKSLCVGSCKWIDTTTIRNDFGKVRISSGGTISGILTIRRIV